MTPRPFTTPETLDISRPRRILLVTDAWAPQVNGVVRTWTEVTEQLRREGHTVEVVHPGSVRRTIKAPRYPEIRLAILPGRQVRKRMREFQPDAVHIATEGPLGIAARRMCGRMNWDYTTSYHTQFPQILQGYFFIPARITYRFMRWFHGCAASTLVPTPTVAKELNDVGIPRTRVWCRGVDTDIFKPTDDPVFDLPRPIFLYVGRVATEKNIEAFLDLDLPGSKAVVGDGPARASLMKKYPDITWCGYKFGEELGRYYASGDVLVFPSRTDTYGVVMLEANACGLPAAALPVTGPKDVIIEGVNGCLDEDLHAASIRALDVNRESCLAHARQNTWTRCAQVAAETFVEASIGRATTLEKVVTVT